MDELTLIREFRSQVPSAPAERRRSAREALVAHSERTGRLDVLRRRPVLTAAVLVLLAGLVTGSALGLGERLLDLIRGKPAPPSVQREFVRMLGNRGAVIPYFDFPKVIKSRIHGVLVFRTSAGPVALWAGPTRGGDKVCFILRKLRPRNFGERVPLLAACGAPGPPAGKSAVASWDSSSSESGGSMAFVYGVAARGVASVEIRLGRGVSRRARVYEHFFAVGVPPEHSNVEEVVAFDARGHTVGRNRVDLAPQVAPPPEPRRTGPFKQLFHVERGRGTVDVAVAPAAGGGVCVELRAPERDEAGCRKISLPLQLLSFGSYGPPGPTVAFFAGHVGGRVKTLELRYEDGSSSRVTPLKSFFLTVLSGKRTRVGHRGLVFVARDASGTIIGRIRLDRRL